MHTKHVAALAALMVLAGLACGDGVSMVDAGAMVDAGDAMVDAGDELLDGPTLYVLEGQTLPVAIVDDLFVGRDTIDLTTFELVGATSACGGEVDYDEVLDAATVYFEPAPVTTADDGAPGCTVGSGSAYSDRFTYRACAVGEAPCFTESATVIINRRPVVADVSRCLPINAADVSLDVATLYTDADAHPLNEASITNTGAGGTHSRAGSTITFTPTDAATPNTYSVAIDACDTAQTPGCDEATWSLQWNDPPVLAGRTGTSTIHVSVGEPETAVPLYGTADRIVTNNGVVSNTIASVAVGASPDGPFGASAFTARGSCTVTEDAIVYAAGATTGIDSCYVRVCETCSTSELCSVAELRYDVVPLPVANDDQVFGLEAADPTLEGASATFTVASLQSNDTPAGLESFAFTGAVPGTTLCSGTVVDNAGTITYTGPADLAPASACRTTDSFTYRVCSPASTTRCDEAAVHIAINQRPVLADAFTCSPINTPHRSLDVSDLFTDPNGDLLNSSSILVSGGSGTSSRAGSVVTWTPTDTTTATTYSVSLTACDDAPVEGCDTAVWTARWNDPPELRTFPASSAFAVVRNEQSTHPISTGGSPILIGTGAVTGVLAGDPIASTAVGAFPVGPFAQSVTTSLGGTCQITDGNVVYTAAGTTGDDACFVQVCESCSGDDVCAVTHIPFAIISAPEPADDSVQAAEGADSVARSTFPISTLLANDLHIDATSFALKSGTGTPSCAGATVTRDGTTVTYVGPNIAGCLADSFVYTVCSPSIPGRCADATVTIAVNRRPGLAAGFTCMPQGSVRGNYTVGPPSFFDADGDGVGTVEAAAPGNPGIATVAGAVVTWAPDNPALARYYDISLYVCDDASIPACTTGTWRTSWNDAPTLSSTFSVGCASPQDGVLCVGAGSSVDLPLDDPDPSRRLISDFGVVVGVPEGAPSPLGTVTITAQGSAGTCSVISVAGVPAAIRYTANAVTTVATDACTVRVCELCEGGDLCSTGVVTAHIVPASGAAGH